VKQTWWLADLRARIASIRADVGYWRRRGWSDTADELSRVATFLEDTIARSDESRRVDEAEPAPRVSVIVSVACRTTRRSSAA
jgi:hypothetical protein